MKFYSMGSFLKTVTSKNVTTLSIAPIGIFFRCKNSYPHVINHQCIHWRQQIELLIVFYYIWYALEFLIKFLYCNANISVSFEQEAYLHENEPRYMKHRKPYAWIKYVFKGCK